MRSGGFGVIEEGKLKGRRFIVPSEVLVEKGELFGQVHFSKACLTHQMFIKDQGCDKCQKEVKRKQKAARQVGL